MNKRCPKPTTIGGTLSLVLATILVQAPTAFGQSPPAKTVPPGVQNTPDVAQEQAAASPQSDAPARTAPAPSEKISATTPAADLAEQQAEAQRAADKQLVGEPLQLDSAVRAAIEEYHNQENAQLRKRIREQLQTLVENQFDRKLAAQQRELERLREQLAVVKEKISRRRELKDAIVQRRIVELTEVDPEQLQSVDESVATWDATGRTLNSGQSISLTEAVSRFNESNEAERIRRGEAPLTVHEVRPTSTSTLLNLQTDPSTVAGLKAQLDVAQQLVDMKKAQYLIGKLTSEAVTEAEAARAAASAEYQKAVRQLELRKKLLTWEIQKAELDCQAARNTWERLQKLERSAPGTLPQQELDAAKLAMRKAELNLQQLHAIAESLEDK